MRTLIRTNLCHSPEANTAFPSYEQGNSTVVAIDDHPLGIKTANRLAWAVGDNNPGIIFTAQANVGGKIQPGKVFTASAWVKYGSSPISVKFAQQGVSSGGTESDRLNTTDWQKVSWTHTAGSTNNYGLRIGGAGISVTGEFFVTGFLFEEAPSVGDWFTGSTLESFYLYHKWTDTPGNSFSEQYRIEVMENFNPQLALQDAKMKSLESILGPSPVKTQNGSLADNQIAAMEKVLRDNALIV